MTASPTTETPARPIHRVAKELVASSGFLLARLGFGFKARALARLEQAGFDAYHYSVLAILDEGARFNLGPIRRTVNIPTLALLFLHPANQGRFAFEKKGKRSIEGIEALEIGFVERARPTLVDDGAGHDVPTKGSVWLDPASGTVLQTDVDYDLDPRDTDRRTRARVITKYRREPKLEILVPDSMREISSRSSISCCWAMALRSMFSRPCCSSSSWMDPLRSRPDHKMMEVSGVRSSCETTATNSAKISA